MNRREMFAGALASALGGIVVPPSHAGGQSKGLEWMLDTFGEAMVASEIASIIDMEDLRRRLNKRKNKDRRHKITRQRRENNNDTVLYRGPVLWGDLYMEQYRVVRGRARKVASGFTRRAMWVGDVYLPSGTKFVMDLRHNIVTPMVEIILTKDGGYRLHLWNFKGEFWGNKAFKFDSCVDEEDLFNIQENMEV